jgi:hypothetical protein
MLVPRGTMHTYQYAVFNGGSIQSWEDIPPRTVNVRAKQSFPVFILFYFISMIKVIIS